MKEKSIASLKVYMVLNSQPDYEIRKLLFTYRIKD